MKLTNHVFFTKFIPILRSMGNFRLPYIILFDCECKLPKDYAMELKPVTSVIQQHLQLSDIVTYAETIEPSEILNKAKNSDVLVVVYGHIDNFETSEYASIFNEVHTTSEFSSNQWVLQKTYGMHKAYTRKLIDDPRIVAIKPQQLKENNLLADGFQKWEDWHTMLLDKNTGDAIQIIWDTREIIGYSKLNDAQKLMCLGFANANDNSNLLYSRVQLSNTIFNNFIISEIEHD